MSYAEEGHRTIGIDFDGVIHNGTYPDFNPPNKGIAEQVRKLKADGWKILLHTVRICNWWYKGMNEWDRYKKYLETEKAIKRYCQKYDIPVDKVWIGEGKPYCRYYIDDSAIEYHPGCDIYWSVQLREKIAKRLGREV